MTASTPQPEGAAAPVSGGSASAGDAAIDPARCKAQGGVHFSWVGLCVAAVVVLVLLLFAYCVGRTVEVPGSSDFWRIAAQPFGIMTAGLLAVAAAAITFRAQRRTSDSATDSARLDREKDIRADAIERCWTRFLWMVDETAAGRRGGLAFPPEVEPVLVHQLLEEAYLLKDASLILFIDRYADEASTDWRMGQAAGPTAAEPEE